MSRYLSILLTVVFAMACELMVLNRFLLPPWAALCLVRSQRHAKGKKLALKYWFLPLLW